MNDKNVCILDGSQEVQTTKTQLISIDSGIQVRPQLTASNQTQPILTPPVTQTQTTEQSLIVTETPKIVPAPEASQSTDYPLN